MGSGRAEIAIVGGGIVGLATAWRLTRRRPDARVVVLEKERDVALHQTGHNSGVLHSGIYYRPGSLKARNCREGKRAMEAFCEQEQLPFERCGKVIVAVEPAEQAALERILERGRANGVRCEPIDAARLRELEPHAAGLRAIHVPETGIVDFGQVARRLAHRVREAGGTILTGARVEGIEERADGVIVRSTAGEVAARWLVNCAGLHSDRVARLAGRRPAVRIVPFRGEYWELIPAARGLCRNLIYPVPDPGFPFLGVHFTRMIGGGVECGPNAVPALAREGYRKSVIRPGDLLESLAYPGFLRLAARHWRTGAGEVWRSFSRRAFVAALRRLVPEVRAEHLAPAPAGVRAQALARDGTLVDDFLFDETARAVHVLNAPSPGATAALAIGERIVERLLTRA